MKKRIVLCGTGSVASINLPGCAFEISRRISANLDIVVTENALRFTTQRALEAVSGAKVWKDEFLEESPSGVAPHVLLTDDAAAVLVYPATANFIAKIAQGLADDLASAVVLCANCPIVVGPCMHQRMWENLATQANVQILRNRDVIVLQAQPADNRVSFGVEEVLITLQEVLSTNTSLVNGAGR